MSLQSDSNLRFYDGGNEGVKLFNNNTTAHIPSGTPNALLFSSHPLQPYQKFSFKFSEIPRKVKEVISVGFALSQPSEIDQGKIGTAVRICLGSKQYRIKDKIFFFYFTPNGRMYLGVDNEEKGCQKIKLKTRNSLWAFIKVSTGPTTIDVINSKRFPDLSSLNLAPLMLHPSRGRNVKLLQNTAHKYDKRLSTSYTFTSQPISIGEYIIVKILDADSRRYNCNLTIGLTTCNPSQLQKDNLPDNTQSFLERSEFWMIITDTSWNFKQYDKITFMITNSNELKIWRNDCTLLKVVQIVPTSRLWLFFDIAFLEGIVVSSCKSNEFGENEVGRIDEVRNDKLISEKNGEQDSECVVCCDSNIEAALYPCGHMCMCYECAREQWRGAGRGKCPMCRVNIRDVLKVYRI